VSDVLEGVDGSALPEKQLLNTELSEQMGELLQLLPDRLREVIVLRVVVGLTTEETAAALGTSRGAVRIDQHRALRRLREAMAHRKIR
jgi:RNA polymerase sigma-70 factor (ECF subfamily)